eukprot:1195069-Prorocentrum_minimum.AAC.3
MTKCSQSVTSRLDDEVISQSVIMTGRIDEEVISQSVTSRLDDELRSVNQCQSVISRLDEEAISQSVTSRLDDEVISQSVISRLDEEAITQSVTSHRTSTQSVNHPSCSAARRARALSASAGPVVTLRRAPPPAPPALSLSGKPSASHPGRLTMAAIVPITRASTSCWPSCERTVCNGKYYCST